jgi:hypothetical protein
MKKRKKNTPISTRGISMLHFGLQAIAMVTV